ncbi:MAG: heat-inducible transcriptional repressor HrcA [Albidovulum sp.]|nr:heat-inducible transcriptional repressor HrcA [Albidovulum sp.]
MKEQDAAQRDLKDRNREVFEMLVKSYLTSGNPIGSRTLSRDLQMKISPATVRNTMQDLEALGLLASPHVSAGRIPTELGLRLYVDELMEVGELNDEERERIESIADNRSNNIETLLDKAGSVLSGLTQTASLVMAPKTEAPIRHIDFVSLDRDRALVVLVMSDGNVENRVFKPPVGQTPASLREAANFVNAFACGLTISELQESIAREISKRKKEIDALATELVERGLAVWESGDEPTKRLIVRGRSNLLEGEGSVHDLDRIRRLFDDLERKRDISQFLEIVDESDGVRIFIGSENKLFSLSGSTLVVSPYMNAERKIVGAVGVIGPTRLNYGRVVPIVDYTAQLVGRIVSEPV